MAEYQPTNALEITEIDEITLCEEGRNPEAQIALHKSKDENPMNLMQRLFCDPSAVVDLSKSFYGYDAAIPMTYDELKAAGEAHEEVSEKISRFREVVTAAYRSLPPEEAKTKVMTSLEQFRSDLMEWASGEGSTKPSNALAEVAKEARALMAAAERGDMAAFNPPVTEVKKMDPQEWYNGLDDATKALADAYAAAKMDMSKAADDMAKSKPAMTEAEITMRKELDDLKKSNEMLLRKQAINDAVAEYTPFANVAAPAELAVVGVALKGDAALAKSFNSIIAGASARIGKIGTESGSSASASSAGVDMHKSKTDYKEQPLFKSLSEKHGGREVSIVAELAEMRNKGNKEAAALLRMIP